MERERIKKALLSSPLFHLSLSSKELFHSNFLGWLGELYPAFFLAVFREMGCALRCSANDFVFKREYENFDLCLLDSDGHILFILENKVKSMPRAEQLKEYEEKAIKKQKSVPEDLMLLSLVTEFPDKEEIERGPWKIRHYDQLSEALQKHKELLAADSYAAALVNDYCVFVQSLHALAQSWHLDLSSPFLLTKEEMDFSQQLRVGDLQDKVRYSQMFEQLNLRLREAYQVVQRTDVNFIKQDSDYHRKVYVSYGFTHGQGLLEAKVKICEDYILLIQLQGNKYCHCIEWISRKQPANHQEAWRRTCALKESLHAFLQVDELPAVFPSVCVDEPIRERNYRHEEPRNYNKYNNNFLYQSKKIREEATIGEVLDAICKDVYSL